MEKLLTKYFWTLNLLTLAVVAYLLSDGTGELVAATINESLPNKASKTKAVRPSVSPKSQAWTMPDGTEILERNIFDSSFDPMAQAETELDPTEFPENVGVDGMPIVPCTGSNVALLATVASQFDTSWSFASINHGAEQKLCRVGDQLDDRQVSGITWRYLFMRGASDECFIDLYGDQIVIKPKKKKALAQKGTMDGIKSISETEKVVSRDVVDNLMSNPAQFIKSVRVRPHKENGKVVGFKLRRFRPNSPLAQLGAKKGDIIHSVNGIQLTSMDQALGAYQSLNSSGSLNFSLTRNGKPLEINVNIN